MNSNSTSLGFFQRSHLMVLVGAWALHFLFFVLSPFTHESGSHQALVLCWIYVGAVLGFSWLLSRLLPAQVKNRIPQPFLLFRADKSVALGALSITGLGLGLHLYDKIVLRGYEYSWCGLGGVRELWIRATHTGPFSAASALGHILVFASVPMIFFALGNDTQKRRGLFYPALLAVAAICLFAYATTIGSRSVIMSFTAALISCLFIQFVSQKGCLNMKRSLLYLTIVGATFVTYSGMLWAGRIKCSSMGEQQKYVSDNAQNLKLVLISDLSDANVVWRKKEFGPSLFVAKPVHSSIGWLKRKLSINPPGDGVLGKIMGMVFVYANSGVGNFQEAFMAGDNRVGKLAFDFLGAWTYKLRLSGAPPSKERSFGVGLIAMPGVIWYDWGLQGLVLAAFFHSLLIVLSYWLICSDGFQSLLGYNLAFILFFVEIFSPIVWAPSLMAFPFIVFSLFATSTFLFLRSQWREFLAFDGGIADKA